MPSIKWTDSGGIDKLLSVFCFYTVLLVGLHAPFLFFHQSLYLSDVTYNLEPVGRFIRDFYEHAGTPPLWNPYIMGGVPQIQAIWPINYFPQKLFLYLPFPLAYSLFLLLHQLVAGMGGFIWLYFRHSEDDQVKRLSSAVLFGLMFMLCGYMTGSSINPCLVAAACWIPLALALVEQLALAPRLWSMTAFGLVFGLQISSGRPELVALSAVLYGSYFVYRAWLIGGGSTLISVQFGRASVMFVMGTIIAIAYAAANILPMLDLAAFEPKIGSLVTLGLSDWSTRWFDVLGILLSQPFGYLDMTRYQLYLSYPGQMPYITSLYLSAPVLVFAVMGFLSGQWKERWFWLFWTAAAFIVAAGGLTPVLARVAPDLLVFRYPIKAAVLVLFCLCLAAAQGWRCWLSGQVKARGAAVLCAVMGLIFLAGVVLAVLPDQLFQTGLGYLGVPSASITGDALQYCRRLPWELIVAGSSGFLLAFRSLPGPLNPAGTDKLIGARFLWLLIIAVLLEVNGASNLWHTVNADFFEEPSSIVYKLLRKNSHDPQTFRVLSLLEDPLMVPESVLNSQARPMDAAFMRYSRTVLKPNTNMDFGIQLINGVTTIPNWSRYFLDTGLLPRSSICPSVIHPAGKSDLPLYRWCQASGTCYVLTSRQTADSEDGKLLPRLDARWFHLLAEYPDLNVRLFEIEKIRPRWSLQDKYRVVPDRYTALSIMNRCDRTGYDPMKMVLINLPPHVEASEIKSAGSAGIGLLPDEAPGTIDLVTQTGQKTTISATLKVPAFLVIADSYYPWWTARDNGKSTPIFVADGLYRAVWLAAGQHKVTWSYSPMSLLWGILAHRIALVFILSVAILAVLNAVASKIRIQ